jgi:hypothetical protein
VKFWKLCPCIELRVDLGVTRAALEVMAGACGMLTMGFDWILTTEDLGKDNYNLSIPSGHNSSSCSRFRMIK